MRFFVISGTSGAGKSIALHALEDQGAYCIDNLPLELLVPFARQIEGAPRHHFSDTAVGVDARNLATDFERFPAILEELRGLGLDCRVLFLDADDETLLKRFSETRRRHPLTGEGVSLAEAIRRERTLLEPIAFKADIRLDTTRTNIHQLRDELLTRVARPTRPGMSILIQSFGYKHGVPVDADFVFDVRCLPNPHWEPRLRALTGKDREVAEFLQAQPSVYRMFATMKDFLETWLPQFEADRRSYLTIAIGCTGGQHRSVYFAERLVEHFKTTKTNVIARHRELS
jgi:UPF0042 nucleotide-binding protein